MRLASIFCNLRIQRTSGWIISCILEWCELVQPTPQTVGLRLRKRSVVSNSPIRASILSESPVLFHWEKLHVQEQSVSVHASLFTWTQRVRYGPRLSQVGFSPPLPLHWYVWYCLEIEFGFLIVDIAPDSLELRFVFLFASGSIFLFNLALVYSVSVVSTEHGSALLSFGTLKPFDPVVHSGFLTGLTATV